MDNKLLTSIIAEVKKLLNHLLTVEPADLNNLPTTGGVYLVFDKSGSVIYVGEAVNLRRRILEDHRGGDEKMSTSTLRRSISKKYDILPGRPTRDWIRENCRFSYIEIKDHDLRDLVETLAIAYFRKLEGKLLNFDRKELIKKCLCADPNCAKCLLVNCTDLNCKVHPEDKKEEFKEKYKNR